MGLALPLAELILREHKRRPLRGLALEFGKSTIYLSPNQLRTLFDHLGITPRTHEIGLDRATLGANQDKDRAFISNTTFYRGIGLDQVHVLDVSDYEGADIVHDICTPIPPGMVNAYDFVYDSSVLDNVFDPCAALRNMAAALKPANKSTCTGRG